MFAIVTTDGRYHGHSKEAKKPTGLKDIVTPVRALTEQEWSQVVAAPSRTDRIDLCSTLGSEVK